MYRSLHSRLHRDELLKLLRKILIVDLEIPFSTGYSSHDLLNMAKILIEFVRLFPDLNKAFVWLMNFGESIYECVCQIVENSGSTILARAASLLASLHASIPVGTLEEEYKESASPQDGVMC